MADPLSIAAGVAGLLSLGIQVTQSMVNFYNTYRHVDSDLLSLIQKSESLLEMLCSLEKAISGRKFRDGERKLVNNIEKSIEACDECIQELQDECEKFGKTPSNGLLAALRTAGRRTMYPFRKSTLQKIDEDIDQIRANLSSAVGVLQLDDTNRIQDDTTEIKTLLELVKDIQISSSIRDWLRAPDATVDHYAACLKKHPGTGSWLIRDRQFTKWLIEENSMLWLNGFAGSGKSVLCSTVIQHIFRRRQSDPHTGIAFFYFTFNDESKRDASAMLRALLLQLTSQLQDGQAELVRLHNSHKSGSVPLQMLVTYLRPIIEKFQEIFIMLDALDESPRGDPREHVLDAVEKMRAWGLQGLHLFCTSRNERDIDESLNLPSSQQVAMQNPGIEEDIANFVKGRLDNVRTLQKWSEYSEQIQESLVGRAKEVFRWVECQLKTLQSYPCSQYHLDRLLDSLPRSLDETYERMLCNIDQDLVQDARRILTLLCFSSRPLTLPELIEGIAVDINEPVGLQKSRRLQDYNDVHTICPGLVNLTYAVREPDTDDEGEFVVVIAHFSVQEYLESDRVRCQKAAIYGLTGANAHAEIAQICLIYLLEPGLARPDLDESICKDYPLAAFAATLWSHHYRLATHFAADLDYLILRLFQHRQSFHTWGRLFGPRDLQELHWPVDADVPTLDSIIHPVFYASHFGLGKVLSRILSTPRFESSEINEEELFCKAIRTASRKGHEDVVRILISNTRDLEAKTRLYRCALKKASYWGHVDLVRLCLDWGAEIDDLEAFLHVASSAALESRKDHPTVVRLLLDRLADIDKLETYSGDALYLASEQGHEQIVRLLLDKGALADWSTENKRFATPLLAASHYGYEKIVQLLLDHGANVSANALFEATSEGHKDVVQLLLDRGANVNGQRGSWYGNALNEASFKGYIEIVQLLLSRGANINGQSGRYGTALNVASWEGRIKVVELLLAGGANVDSQSGKHGNALNGASRAGHIDIVELLLDRGADMNAQSGKYGNALSRAANRGHTEVVQLLLDRGANVDAQDGDYANALSAAASGGHARIVQLLLDRGANIDAQSAELEKMIAAAAEGRSMEVLQFFLDEGANINASTRYYDALTAASAVGWTDGVQLLLDRGGSVNSSAGYCGALAAAAKDGFGGAIILHPLERSKPFTGSYSRYGRREVVRLLLDNGANINDATGYSDALVEASSRGHREMVQLLLDRGANINGPTGYCDALKAASRGYKKTVQSLQAWGATRYRDALIKALGDGSKEVVYLLLDRGALWPKTDNGRYSEREWIREWLGGINTALPEEGSLSLDTDESDGSDDSSEVVADDSDGSQEPSEMGMGQTTSDEPSSMPQDVPADRRDSGTSQESHLRELPLR